MRFLFCLLFMTAIGGNIRSQNLVINGGFEILNNCNPSVDTLNCPPWFTPTTGTSDNYHQCCSGSFNSPYNNFGYHDPHSGGGYAGMIVLTNSGGREYIEGRLSAPLVAGVKYCIEFYAAVSDYSRCGMDAIGMYFSNDSIVDYSGFFPLLSAYYPQVANETGRMIADTVGWTLIADTFIANGGERFITIGNFFTNANTNTIVIDSSIYFTGCYMYIDDVAVHRCTPGSTISTENNSFVPNAFSPNGDGNNDLLFVRGKNIGELSFTIYSRWGEKIFETNDLDTGWDGTFRGEELESAVFVYALKITYLDGLAEIKKGNITLVR